MAVADISFTENHQGRIAASWGTMAATDTGIPFATGLMNAVSMNTAGTDNMVQMEGSNDGSTWVSLEDMAGFGGAAGGSGRMLQFLHVPAFIRPIFVEGTVDGVHISAMVMARNSMRKRDVLRAVGTLPAYQWDFTAQTALDPRITATIGSVHRRVDEAGLLDALSANTFLMTHDPVTWKT